MIAIVDMQLNMSMTALLLTVLPPSALRHVVVKVEAEVKIEVEVEGEERNRQIRLPNHSQRCSPG